MAEITPSREAVLYAARVALTEMETKGWQANPAYWVGRLESALSGVLRAVDTEAPKPKEDN